MTNQHLNGNQIRKVVSVDDICNSMKKQLHNLINWAKCIPPFGELNLDDQVALLKANAGEELLLGFARKSIGIRDALLLGSVCEEHHHPSPDCTDCNICMLLPRHTEDPDLTRICSQVLEHVVTVLREFRVDQTELACLKAIMFFDPSKYSTSEASES